MSFLLTFRIIHASPLIMVEAEGIVDGYVGESIGSKPVVLSLNDPDYYFEIEDYEDISDWFEDIPEGLEAYVSGHQDQEIYVSFEGTPEEEKDEFIKIRVPDGYIIDSNSDDSIGDLENTPSEKAVYLIEIREPLAYYDRESIISGIVGQELEEQFVWIKLENTTCEASMMGREFEPYNGLTGKVVEILPDNIVKVSYSGIPLEEDDSLIHTLLKDEDLKCDRDLKVPDREDVRYAIIEVKKEEPVKEPEVVIPEPVDEEEIIPFVIPYTGIE